MKIALIYFSGAFDLRPSLKVDRKPMNKKKLAAQAAKWTPSVKASPDW
jgi:hypothetical protein